MPTVVVERAYGLAPSYRGAVPVVEVIIRPVYGGAEYRAVAVVDSGAEISFVPHGIPRAHAWTARGIAPGNINPMGGPRTQVPRYLVSLRLNAIEWSIPVYEQPKNSSIKCILLGHDVLRQLIVDLDGPAALLRMTRP